jgi:hypothetical protein
VRLRIGQGIARNSGKRDRCAEKILGQLLPFECFLLPLAVQVDRAALGAGLLAAKSTLSIQFVSLHEGVDTSTPNGRLVFGIFASIAEFERELIRDRVRSGIAAARARGKRLGRPRRDVDTAQIAALRAEGRSWRDVGRVLGVGVATARAAFQARAKNPSDSAPVSD